MDIIKIDNILISEGTFDADFYFEITTPFYEGINILLFDNVLDEKFEYKQLIKKNTKMVISILDIGYQLHLQDYLCLMVKKTWNSEYNDKLYVKLN